MARAASTGGSGKSGRSQRTPTPPPTGQQRVGWRRFVRESWGELRKVQWPGRPMVVQGTIVVGIVTVFFAIYLTVVDYAAVRIVRELDKLLT